MVTEIEAIQRIARLTPLDDVLMRLDALVQPVPPRAVARDAALGRVLARDLAVTARPGVPLALRDGWAVSAAIYVGIVADVEGLLISCMLRKWQTDVPSLVHAYRLRGGAG